MPLARAAPRSKETLIQLSHTLDRAAVRLPRGSEVPGVHYRTSQYEYTDDHSHGTIQPTFQGGNELARAAESEFRELRDRSDRSGRDVRRPARADR